VTDAPIERVDALLEWFQASVPGMGIVPILVNYNAPSDQVEIPGIVLGAAPLRVTVVEVYGLVYLTDGSVCAFVIPLDIYF